MDNFKQRFFEYSKQYKSVSTVRGYMSSLKKNSVVGAILQEFDLTDDIFEITDLTILNRIYLKLLSSEPNIKTHARYSASVRMYMDFIKHLKEK